MNFISTRDKSISYLFSDAIEVGLAPDGGLLVPATFPNIDNELFYSNLSYAEFAEKLLSHFITEQPFKIHLKEICSAVFNFPIPLKGINNNTFLLELFHGPTASFKDFGTKFLAEVLSYRSTKVQPTTILVATSGDTGAAVANAFYGKANLNVIILYPKNLISPLQEMQICSFDKNICAVAVENYFDHCQFLVKSAFSDPWFRQHLHLNSANSINIGRLLPQMIYYAYTSIQFVKQHLQKPGFVVPTGNLGNAVAAFWAQKLKFPIREIVIATNDNRTLLDYLKTGIYQPQLTRATLASAMDVGNPSNFERLLNLFPNFKNLKNALKIYSAKDAMLKNSIKECYTLYGKIICPHTAAAYSARKHLSNAPWILVATADPGKFNEVIKLIIGKCASIPKPLKHLSTNYKTTFPSINSLNELKQIIEKLNWADSNAKQ